MEEEGTEQQVNDLCEYPEPQQLNIDEETETPQASIEGVIETEADIRGRIESQRVNVQRETEKGKDRPQKRARVGKKTSSIWDHFTKIDNSSRAACNYCGLDYAADTKLNGTSTLWLHVEKKCKKCPFSDWVEQMKKQQMAMQAFTKNKKTTIVEEEVACSGQLVKYNHKKVRGEIATYFILDELPFRHVEGKGFQRLIRYFFPKFEFPSRFTIARDIYQMFLDEKKQLKNDLVTNRVSLTTDCWTSIQNISYLCLTAHWIDTNWKLQKRIINFIQVPSHKGEMVAKELINCLNDWGITKVFAVTVDNAASNNVALANLKEYLLEKTHGDIPVGGEMFHVRCCAHVLNLIVGDGLKELNEAISCIRNAVRYVRSSPSRLKRFKESCKDVNIESKALLCLDVVTRWNSTYMMLEAALKFKKAFKNLEGDANYTKYYEEEKINNKKIDGPPKNEDWDKAEVFVKFLKKFYDLTVKFSGSLYVTSNLFLPHIFSVQADLTTLTFDSNALMAKMARTMKVKYDKYWGRTAKLNMLTFIANILDPRYKLEVVNRGFKFLYADAPEEAEKMIQLVTNMLGRLYAFYKKKLSSCSPRSSPLPRTPSVRTHSPSFVSNETADSFLLAKLNMNDEEDTNDLEDYLADRREKLKDNSFEILEWWNRNAVKYKIVSHMAKDVLAVQMSTVASESAFSTSGRILDPFRSSLSPKMVEALICTKNWLSAGSDEPIVLRQYMDEIEALEISEQVAPADGSCITSIDKEIE